MTDSYSSVLTATVAEKGRLVFDYKFGTYSSQNVFSFAVDGQSLFDKAYSPEAGILQLGTVTNDVTNPAGATFRWTYSSQDPEHDFAAQVGVWLSNVRWIPESELPVVRNGPSGEQVEVPSSWFRRNGLVASGAGLAECELAADLDSDGDGVPNWAEYVTGTDPLLKSDAPHCTIEMVDGRPVVEYANEDTLMDGYQAVIRGKTSLDGQGEAWRLKNDSHRFFRAFIETE